MNAWCFPYGQANCTAHLKTMPEDFEVIEELGFTPDGRGEHLFLLVEKSAISTPELIDAVCRTSGLQPRQIGYSGLKDKQAVTRQWLSLHLPGSEIELNPAEDAGYRIIEQVRNSKKLRIGSHRYNRFRVILREVTGWGLESEQQLMQVSRFGMANYFGEQRFGRQQDNVARALASMGRKRLGRQKRSLYLSALRSFLFNRVLSTRIEREIWSEPLPGDCFMLGGSHSFFCSPIDDSIIERYQQLDVSSCGSLYGTGDTPLDGAARAIEDEVCVDNPDVVAILDAEKVKRQMRAHRVAVDDLQFEYDDSRRQLALSCRLPAGSYLTTLLDHIAQTRQPAW